MSARKVLGAVGAAALAFSVHAQPAGLSPTAVGLPTGYAQSDPIPAARKGDLARLPPARWRYLTVGRQADSTTTVLVRIPLRELAAR